MKILRKYFKAIEDAPLVVGSALVLGGFCILLIVLTYVWLLITGAMQ
jgi:hypothetical protein